MKENDIHQYWSNSDTISHLKNEVSALRQLSAFYRNEWDQLIKVLSSRFPQVSGELICAGDVVELVEVLVSNCPKENPVEGFVPVADDDWEID